MLSKSKKLLPLVGALVAVLLTLTALPAAAAPVVEATIPAPQPQGIAVNSTTHRAYTTQSGNVGVIDTNTNAYIDTISAVCDNDGICVNPTLNRIYTANWNWNSVTVINGADYSDLQDVPTGSGTYRLAANTVTNKVYVTCNGSGYVTVIEPDNSTHNIGGIASPLCVAVDSTRNRIYVTRPGPQVVVIDGTTDTILTTFNPPGGGTPRAIACDVGLNVLYIAVDTGQALRLDAATGGFLGYIAAGGVQGVDVNQTTHMVYIANSATDNVTVFNPSTGLIVGNVGVGDSPWFVSCDQSNYRAFVANHGSSTVSVILDAPTYTISASANPAGGGNVTGAGDYAHGSTVNLHASANAGYHFVNWTEGGSQVSTNPDYSFTATGNRTLVANFGFQVQVFADDGGGTVSGGGTFAAGSSVTVHGNPIPGCHFIAWWDPEVGTVSYDADYTFAATVDRQLHASFGYQVSTAAEPSPGGNATGGGLWEYGMPRPVLAFANGGYHFVNWTEGGSQVSTDWNYSFTPTSDRDLVANFALNTYTIAASANPAEGGSVTGGGDYTHGQTVNLHASADTDYHFVNWTEGGSEVSTNADYSFTATVNRTLVANFEPDNPVPHTDSIDPTKCVAGSSGFTLTVNGSSFIADSVVRIDGADRVTHFGSSTMLTADILASDVVGGGTASIRVFNPTPGGGLSNAQTLTIIALPSVITEAATTIGSATATLNGQVVDDGGEDVTRGFAWRQAGTPPGPWTEWSDAGTQGEGPYSHPVAGLTPNTDYECRAWASNLAGRTDGDIVSFTTDYPDPVLTDLVPGHGRAGDSIAVFGGEFDTAGTVWFGGVASPSTTWTPERVDADVPPGLTAGTVAVTIETIHGKTSNPLDFTVDPYNVDASVPDGHGTALPAHQDKSWGDSASVDINAASGYHLASITDNGAAKPLVDPYVIDDIREDHALVVTFAKTDTRPIVDSIEPASAAAGSRITVNGQNFGATQGSSYVTINGARAQAVSWSDGKIVVIVPAEASSGSVEVFTAQGGSNADKTVTIVNSTWFLAEGTTAWGFSTYITIENPNPDQLTARITYMDPNQETGSGRTFPPRIVTLPPLSQTTVDPRWDLGNTDFSTRVDCIEGQDIAVDRTMFWTGEGAPSMEAHSSIGVTAPSKNWYLPEGSSAWGFDTWTLVENPTSGEASVTLTYMTEGAGPKTLTRVVPGYSRASYSMARDIGAHNASIQVTSDAPVIAERSQYRNDRREGSCSVGTTTPSRDYFLAEGSTAWGFTTYVLVQNPGAESALVTLTYMTPSGQLPQPAFEMPPNSRRTIKVNDVAGIGQTDLSTLVQSDRAIIAERSMYWGSDAPLGEACHTSIGLPGPHMSFYLPDGQTSNGHETYTLVQNPNPGAVTVKITYLTASGEGNATFTDEIAAGTRRTFKMSEKIASGRAAILVESLDGARPVMVERSMYWDSMGAGTETIGAYTD